MTNKIFPANEQPKLAKALGEVAFYCALQGVGIGRELVLEFETTKYNNDDFPGNWKVIVQRLK